MCGEIYVILMYPLFDDVPVILGYFDKEEDAVDYCHLLAELEENENNWYNYKRIGKIDKPTYGGEWDS